MRKTLAVVLLVVLLNPRARRLVFGLLSTLLKGSRIRRVL
jgi:hypothetical protein